MTRRGFVALAAASGRRLSARPVPILVEIDPDIRLFPIPPEFMGLGYEISSVAAGVLSPGNHDYVALVRRLGPNGVVRIGGNTSDYARFSSNETAHSSPKETVVNEGNLRDLAGFLDATGWRLIWGLNLGRGTPQAAAIEASAVARAAGGKLLAFEIGNEPDLFGQAHRPKSYGYEDYLREYRRYKAAIRRAVPQAPFAGPDAAGATGWVTRFAADEGKDLKLLTHHYYRECASPAASLERLLNLDPKLDPQLHALRAASVASGLPYRICEVNSLCGGGKPGVSDTLGAALWTLDYLFQVARAHGSGVNVETGVNQLGFISWYSPIARDDRGTWTARAPYYGLLAFAHAARGNLLRVDYQVQGINLNAYATGDRQGRVQLTIINKDEKQDAVVTVKALQHARVTRLTGPSLTSKSGISLRAASPISGASGHLRVLVPAASAAILTGSAR